MGVVVLVKKKGMSKTFFVQKKFFPKIKAKKFGFKNKNFQKIIGSKKYDRKKNVKTKN